MRGRRTLEGIKFQSKWFEKCIRDYFGLGDAPITEELLASIKYLYVSTNDYTLGFCNEELPMPFSFSDAGDEWWCACISDTGRFQNIDEFIEIHKWGPDTVLYLTDKVLEQEKELQGDTPCLDDASMKAFEEKIKTYWAEQEDYDALDAVDILDMGMLIAEDFTYLRNLETLRLMSCSGEIHSLKFLESLPKLKVLEIGEVRLNDLYGLDKLIGLDKLCIWTN